jgi:hypothetical protein
MKNKPTIVVVAFNRIDSIARLLNSLSNAQIEKDTRLIISIDYSGDNAVEKYANKFNWEYGEKIVITHEKNLGLRKHVLKCGDLTQKYGSIILLEDDLVVSPLFYQYTKKALDFYDENDKVAGISLYNHKYNVNAQQTFEPLSDGFDNYWLQFASSWGQAWSAKQWQGFKFWYDNEATKLLVTDDIPTNIVNWPESSWLKYFIKYLVVTNKYFIYPRSSLTTNFSDIGTNVIKVDYTYQVSLALSKHNYNFSTYSESNAIYDVFFEVSPSILKKFNKTLEAYDFEVDLYGTKLLSNIKKEYLLSNKELTNKALLSFSRDLRPHDFNIVSDFLSGNKKVFNLSPSKKFKVKESIESLNSNLDYYFYSLPFKKLISLIVEKIKYKIKKNF